MINPFVYGLMSKNFRQYFYDAIHDILGKLTPKKVKRRAKAKTSSGVHLNGNGMRRSVPNTQFDNHFDLRDNINVRYSSPTIREHRSHSKLTDDDRALADELGLSVIVLESENDSCQRKFPTNSSTSPIILNGSSLISVL